MRFEKDAGVTLIDHTPPLIQGGPLLKDPTSVLKEIVTEWIGGAKGPEGGQQESLGNLRGEDAETQLRANRGALRAEKNPVSCLSDALGAADISKENHHGGIVMKGGFWTFNCLSTLREDRSCQQCPSNYPLPWQPQLVPVSSFLQHPQAIFLFIHDDYITVIRGKSHRRTFQCMKLRTGRPKIF